MLVIFQNKYLTDNYFIQLQGLPSCPINIESIRSSLPEIKCWGSLPHLFKEATNTNSEGISGNYNANITNNNNTLAAPITPTTNLPNPHKFHKFHKAHKKMPFRGRRGWCGCLQVSSALYFYSKKVSQN